MLNRGDFRGEEVSPEEVTPEGVTSSKTAALASFQQQELLPRLLPRKKPSVDALFAELEKAYQKIRITYAEDKYTKATRR